MTTSLISLLANSQCAEKTFFGLRPWYHYLPTSDFKGCSIRDFQWLPNDATTKSGGDIPLVLLAVVDDLLRLAGLVAVGFVIVGAFKYITSQGAPDEAAQAQSTIINALIGLAIAVIAAAFVSFLGNSLGG